MIDWNGFMAEAGDRLWMDADAVDVARVIRKSGGYGYLASAYTKRMAVLGHDAPVRDAFAWRAWFAAFHAPLHSPLEAGHALVEMDRVRFTGLDGRVQTLPGDYQEFDFGVDDEAFWNLMNDPLLRGATCVVVPPIYGRDHSAGAAREVRLALAAKIPVYVLAELER